MSIGIRCSVHPILSAFFCGLVTKEYIPEYMPYVGKGVRGKTKKK